MTRIYRNKQKNDEILDRAMELVESVPYKVSLRWLFYNLLQEGIYKTKDDYETTFKGLISRARHSGRRDWKPDTIADDTREIDWRGWGYLTEKGWLGSLDCDLDKIQNQDYFVMICFEARAMANQFRYYTKNIPLVPFGGDVSIPLKYEVAKTIEEANKKYGKPAVIIYFGDCDEKGKQIKNSAIQHIRNWCSIDFKLVPGGLTLEPAKRFKVPENFEKPDEYQWEALTDEQAEKIIKKSVEKYQDKKRFAEIEKKEKEIMSRVSEALEKLEF